MKITLNFLLLSTFIFCSSLLNAATVNFPIDQPVIQRIEEEARKVGYSANLSYTLMQTHLTLKEKNSQFWNLEALYLDGWYGVPAPEEVSFIRVFPDAFPQIINIADSPVCLSGTKGATGALAYGFDGFLNLHLATLWYLQDRELAVGDSFTIKANIVYNCKYEILDINDENVVYSIKIEYAFCPLEGVGFWNRKNGLVGQFHVDGLDKHEIHFKFSSLPEE
jgi:hypothetical protein